MRLEEQIRSKKWELPRSITALPWSHLLLRSTSFGWNQVWRVTRLQRLFRLWHSRGRPAWRVRRGVRNILLSTFNRVRVPKWVTRTTKRTHRQVSYVFQSFEEFEFYWIYIGWSSFWLADICVSMNSRRKIWVENGVIFQIKNGRELLRLASGIVVEGEEGVAIGFPWVLRRRRKNRTMETTIELARQVTIIFF